MKRKSYKIKISSKKDFFLEYSYYSADDFKSVNKPLFLYLHGLPGAPLRELSPIPEFLGSIGFDSIVFNYPGMWSDNGYFTSNNVLAGIMGILEHIKSKINPPSINLYGESFGGAIAINILGREISPIPINKIILRSPLLDIKPILNFLPATLSYLKQARIINVLSIDSLMKEINTLNPTKFYDQINKQQRTKIWGVIGSNDEVLPANEMINAVKSFPNINLDLWNDFPHNDIDISLYKKFFKKIKNFIEN